jgi:hypothetical protein
MTAKPGMGDRYSQIDIPLDWLASFGAVVVARDRLARARPYRHHSAHIDRLNARKLERAPVWALPATQRHNRYIRRSGLTNVQSSHGPPDQHPLDFRRALEDGEDLGVPVPALNGVVAGVAVAAEDLDRLLCHPDGRLARDQL